MESYLTVALILIAIGVIFLAAEIVFPTGGILVVAALLFFGLGVGTILYYGDTLEATVAITGMAIGLPAAGFVAVSAWRRLSIGRALDAPDEIRPGMDSPGIVGRVGKTVSPMRPSGSVVFDGQRVDALTEGMMIDAGVWVRCVAVKGGRVIVRRMDPPKGFANVDPNTPPEQAPLPDFDQDLDRA